MHILLISDMHKKEIESPGYNKITVRKPYIVTYIIQSWENSANAEISMHEKDYCVTISHILPDVKYEIVKVLS